VISRNHLAESSSHQAEIWWTIAVINISAIEIIVITNKSKKIRKKNLKKPAKILKNPEKNP
jgi:hypothetical protein